MNHQKLHEAICFAAVAHQNQLRKGSETPYIAHPCEVMQILTAADCEETLLIAGLLHDTLEDTAVTAGELREVFGEDVAVLVCAASEDKSQSWEQRKQHTIAYLSDGAGLDGLLLACADKLSNLRSIRADLNELGESLWSRFKRGREQQRWYYRSLLDAFAPLADYVMYDEYAALYAEIFEETAE
ncbi:MAG: HD domain-containing protein [Butyricicoccus sp.]